MITPRERKLLERAESRGVPINWRAAEAGFRFTVSPVTAGLPDVDVLVRIAAVVSQLVEHRKCSFELTGIVVFPIIADPAIYARPDFLTRKRSDNAYFVGRNIDFAAWKRARAPGKAKLAIENFRASVEVIPDRHFSQQSKQLLVQLIHEAKARCNG